MISIRRRLIFLLLSIIVIVGGVTLLRSYLDAKRQIEELFDAEMAQTARSFQAIVLHNLQSMDYYSVQRLLDYQSAIPAKENTRGNNLNGHFYERKLAFQVWEAPDRLILHSASAPVQPLSPHAMTPEKRGYSDVVIDDEQWRVFSLWDPEFKYLIQVGERNDVREELISEIVAQLVTPSLISLPVLAIMIWLGIGRGLQPVQNAADEVTRRDPQYLEPMQTDYVPIEIKPLVNELNALFARLEQALEKERRFTDEAAHELRTPMAALKTQAQVALRAGNEHERNTALQHIVEGVDRADHLVQQMLTLARLNTIQTQKTLIKIELRDFTQDLIAQLAHKALNKNIAISFSAKDKAFINGEPVALRMLLSNIIDNAINYTPMDGTVEIELDSLADKVSLAITDSGPGIATEFQQRIFERYFRIQGSGVEGCGLGLAIASQCAELLQVRMTITNLASNNGLKATLVFASA